MNNKKFIVYCHTFPNDKKYIGITSKKPNARWENGKGYSESHQNVMYRAIQKYGWDNVKHEILFKDLTFEQAKEKEKELIKKYHTFVHDPLCNGYNMTLGGEGALGHKATQKVLDTNRKRLVGKKGKDCPNSRAIICDNIEYESLTQFKENTGASGKIYGWLNGTVGMPKEWYDKGLHYKDTDFSIIKCQEKSWNNKIYYDNKTFNSQAECARYIGVNSATVCCWLNGTNKMPKEIKEKGLKRL